MSTEGTGNQEQSFSIQPHPAKTNNPADLQPGGESSVFNTPGLVIPGEGSLPEPSGSQELQAARLNLKGGNPGQSFSIQPHPAKTNNPADLQPSGGLNVFNTPGPVIPSEGSTLPEPLSRKELQAAQAQLNSKQ